MSENTANIVALIGATGQGKSATFKQWLRSAPPPRSMLWDPMDEYREHGRACATLAEVVNATKADTFAVRFVPRGDADAMWQKFDVFCKVAYERGRVALGVEELSIVTRPNGGPAGWAECTLRGRHKALSIVGLAQRPALVDKNFFSGATRVRCFRLNFAPDVATMAGVLGVADERIAALLPLHYLERDMATGQVSDGVLTFAAQGAQGAEKKKSAARPRRRRR